MNSAHPTYPLTITATAMRDINRSAVLEIIRRESPISRTAIAARLDVSLPTVMRIIDDLIEEGLVRDQGKTEWSGGRRRALVEYNAEGFVVLGVDLGGMRIYGALPDLGGNIIAERSLEKHGTTGEDSYQRLVELIDELLADPALEGRPVRGIGVGAPGITRHREGVVKWAAALNWRDFPLKARLTERYQLPVTVDNDVNLAALGELWFGVGQNSRNMILIAVGAGIGAGIIIDGALYRGAHEASGEIGGMLPGREFLGKDYVDFGALESMASGTGIARRARAPEGVAPEGVAPGGVAPGGVAPEGVAPVQAEGVFAAARLGHEWARAIVDDVVDYLAIAIANLAVSFDPEIIVLGGGVAGSADLLIAPILERINGAIPDPPQLVVSTLGRRAAVMGAITNVLYRTADFYVVRKLT